MGKLVGIDLFSGAGGMSLGAELAGINVRVAVECDQNAALTYHHNAPHIELLNSDIRNYRPDRKSFGRSDLIVFGGPPCQGFSTSNQRTRSAKNPINWLYREFLRVVQLLEPAWVVMENVKGLAETERGLFLDNILNAFERYGYKYTHGIMCASDFGVPQERLRFFLVASRDGNPPNLPSATHNVPITVKEALWDLPRLSYGSDNDCLPYKDKARSDYAKHLRRNRRFCRNNVITINAQHIIDRFKHVPPGGNWQDIPAHLMQNYKDRTNCHTGIYHRLHLSRPAKVIGNFRKNMLIHPTQNRSLSVREAARLQSFPDGFEFQGSIGFQQQQVGNAVPPMLAKSVFQSIMKEY